MAEEVMTQIQREGQPVFAENTENDNSAVSSTGEETNTTQTPSDGGEQKPDEKNKVVGEDKGFADHPRWKEREEQTNKRFNEQEVRHTQELQKLREEIEAKYGNKEIAKAPVEVPSWFGGDEQQWTEFQKWNEGLAQKAQEEAIQKISAKQTQEQKSIEEASAYLNAEVDAIESDKSLNPKGEKVDKNKLYKFVFDNDLVDSKGRWNYKAGWRIMQAEASKAVISNLDDRKKIAGATTSENRAETKPSSTMTNEDFENPSKRPW